MTSWPGRRLRLRIRTRIALWCALLVTLSGAAVLVGALVITQRTLDAHAPKPSLSQYSTDPVELRSEQFAAVETNRILVEDTTAHVRNIGLIGLAVLAVASLGIGWLVAARMLAPATRLAATAREMTVADLGRRVNAQGPQDELKTLSDAFDSMLDRLDQSFARQRRFVADASHELRTPFAALRSQVDVALQGDFDQDSSRRTLAEMGSVLDRGSALVNAMLALSRAETLARTDDIELTELVAEVVTAAPGIEQVRLVTHLSGPAVVVGDPVLVEQLVNNLVRNAVTYNRPAGLLAVSVVAELDSVVLRVANDGPAIASDDVAALLARFHRATTSATAPGFGLGLPIVSTIATAHGAELTIDARAAGGLDITVRFPTAAG